MKSIVSSRFRLLPLVLLSIIFLSLISSQAVQAIPTPATAPTAVTITIETFSGGPAESDGPDPSLTGEAYTVSFTVRPAVSGVTPYGTVVISDGDGNTCSKTATSGEALNGYGWSCNLTSTTAGPFKDLKSLRYGDRVTIESNGINYIYEVRESNLVSPSAVDSVFQSEERDWVTLVTCEYYNPLSGEYTLRRVIRAVLVIIE